MITMLIYALLYIGVVALIGWIAVQLLAKTGLPAIVSQIVWIVVFLISVLILLDVFGIDTPALNLNNN